MTEDDLNELLDAEDLEYEQLDQWLKSGGLQRVTIVEEELETETKKDDDKEYPAEDQGEVEADLTEALAVLDSVQEWFAFAFDKDLNGDALAKMHPLIKEEGAKVYQRIVDYLNDFVENQ
jgi:exosome complex RNA-binding protein Csl4